MVTNCPKCGYANPVDIPECTNCHLNLTEMYQSFGESTSKRGQPEVQKSVKGVFKSKDRSEAISTLVVGAGIIIWDFVSRSGGAEITFGIIGFECLPFWILGALVIIRGLYLLTK